MNITSLLQEAPSLDRTRRNKQQWDDSMAAPRPQQALNYEEAQLVQAPNQAGPSSIGGSRHVQSSKNEFIHSAAKDPALYGLAHPTSNGPTAEKQNEKGGLGEYMDHEANPSARYKKELQQHTHQGHGFEGPGPANENRALTLDSRGEFQPAVHSPVPKRVTNGPIAAPVQTNTATLLPPPRTPSPSLDPAHLGSFIYPSLPFPIRPSKLPYNRRTTLTIIVPASYLPASSTSILTDKRARRIWGGIQHIDERRIYTDDSDVLFAALHSGLLQFDEKLFEKRRDLELTLRLYPVSDYGRYFGGPGAAGLTSASWGNSHEGCAFTIQTARWVAPHTARSYTRQNRKARMAEYAQRRAAVMNDGGLSSISVARTPPLDEVAPSIFDLLKPLPVLPNVDPIELEISSLSLTGGWQDSATFKYSPMSLYLMLFAFDPNASIQPPPAKRRKLEEPNAIISTTPPPQAREVTLFASSKPKERIVLAPKIRPLPTDNATMQIDAETPRVGLEVVYDVYRQTREVTASELTPGTAAPVKGVRFATDTKPAQEAAWTKELLYSDLGVHDVAFGLEGLVVGDTTYPVETWSWKSTGRDTARKRVVKSVKKVFKGRRKRMKKDTSEANADAMMPAVSQPPDLSVLPTKAVAAEEPIISELSKPKEPSPGAEEKEEGELSG